MTDPATPFLRPIMVWRVDAGGIVDDATAVGIAACVEVAVTDQGTGPPTPMVEVLMPAATTQIPPAAAEMIAEYMLLAAREARAAAEGGGHS